jgi:ankyrin repeat protein
VDVCDADGNTALHVALAAGKADVLDELLAAIVRRKGAPSNTRRAPSDSDVIPGICEHGSVWHC